MTTKRDALVESVPLERRGRINPQGTMLKEDISEKAPEADLEHDKQIAPEILAFIKVIERLAGEKKQEPPRYKRFLTHPLLLILVSGIAGGGITAYYTWQQKRIEFQRSLQQQDLTSRRSFSDELNRTRVQKFGEVYEQIDKNEPALDEMLSKANQNPGSNQENFKKIRTLIEEDLVIINKNRFWLGKPAYKDLSNYLAITDQLVFDMLLGPPGIDLSELLRKREEAKQDVERVRDMFLAGEPE